MPAETAASATSITADTSLHGANFSPSHNPWQQPPSGKQKEKVLVTVCADKHIARPERPAGKGWTVILNASVERPDPVPPDPAPQSTGPTNPAPQSTRLHRPTDPAPQSTGLHRPTATLPVSKNHSLTRRKPSQKQGKRKVRTKDSEKRGDIR